MPKVYVWEAKTRQLVAGVFLEAPPPDSAGPRETWVSVKFGVHGHIVVPPYVARQFAHTLLAAADVADEEREGSVRA